MQVFRFTPRSVLPRFTLHDTARPDEDTIFRWKYESDDKSIDVLMVVIVLSFVHFVVKGVYLGVYLYLAMLASSSVLCRV